MHGRDANVTNTPFPAQLKSEATHRDFSREFDLKEVVSLYLFNDSDFIVNRVQRC